MALKADFLRQIIGQPTDSCRDGVQLERLVGRHLLLKCSLAKTLTEIRAHLVSGEIYTTPENGGTGSYECNSTYIYGFYESNSTYVQKMKRNR